jgi:hypothetical protein
MTARIRLLGLLSVAVTALAAAAIAQATTTVEQSPFTADVTLCSSGNTVSISGTLLAVTSTTTTPSGGTVETIHFQPQGVSGIDTTTGTMYRAVGLTRDTTVSFPAGDGFTDTFVNRFHIQATGGGESFLVTETYHITVSPDGTVRVEFDKFESTC